MIALLLMLAQDTALLDHANAVLSAEHRCTRDPDSGDVTVCALRRADRYRVPLVVHDPGDPAHEGVWEERERLLRRPNPVESLSPFLVGGGMAGVSATLDIGGSAHSPRIRPLAP